MRRCRSDARFRRPPTTPPHVQVKSVMDSDNGMSGFFGLEADGTEITPERTLDRLEPSEVHVHALLLKPLDQQFHLRERALKADGGVGEGVV